MGAKKDLIEIVQGEKLLIVVAMGYAAQEGKAHTSKPLEKLHSIQDGDKTPDWFLSGVNAAQLAPTANNQQKFMFSLTTDGSVRAGSLGGAFSRIDLGIVKRHFEIGTSLQGFTWA
jgi:hypothetical protein